MTLPPVPRTLAVEPLTTKAFAPFGEVIEAGAAARHFSINDGYAERYHALAHVDIVGAGGHAIVSIFRAKPRVLPMAVERMERHPLGSQAFVALSPMPFMVVVAAPAEVLDLSAIRCFLASTGQGVNYARGTWHHPLIAIDGPGDFLVIDRGGPAVPGNCDEVVLAHGSLWINR
ncbi:MAG: ureidoglycolate lyase [Betaproteobacteria bacterium]